MNTLYTLATDEIIVHDGPGHWWPIFPIFWLVAFIAVAVFVTTMRRRRWGHCGPHQSGHARLAERFAAGEIDAEEYRSRKAVLDEGRSR